MGRTRFAGLAAPAPSTLGALLILFGVLLGAVLCFRKERAVATKKARHHRVQLRPSPRLAAEPLRVARCGGGSVVAVPLLKGTYDSPA